MRRQNATSFEAKTSDMGSYCTQTKCVGKMQQVLKLKQMICTVTANKVRRQNATSFEAKTSDMGSYCTQTKCVGKMQQVLKLKQMICIVTANKHNA
jgi:hypothetical protein